MLKSRKYVDDFQASNTINLADQSNIIKKLPSTYVNVPQYI